MLLDILTVLFNLKLDFAGRGKGVSRTPDDLFREYMDYIPLLPIAVAQWVLSTLTIIPDASLTRARLRLLSMNIKHQIYQLLQPAPVNNMIYQFWGKQ